MKKSLNLFKRIAAVAVAAVFMLMPITALAGCSWIFDMLSDGYVDFTKTSIDLEVGDEYDLDDIISSNTDNYFIGSSNTAVAEVSGSVLSAVGAGVARITASLDNDYSSTLTVRVSQKVETSVVLTAYGELVRTVGDSRPIVFSAATTGDAASDRLEWYINGVKTDNGYSSALSLVPTEAGEYVITVKCVATGVSDSMVLRVYNAINAIAEYDGELEQNLPYTHIDFSVNISGDQSNPADIVEWFVNGKLVQSGEDRTFTLYPSAGEHVVSVKVNGVLRAFGDKKSVTVRCYGSVTPAAAPEIVYDNVYPHIYIEYDVVGLAKVEITAPDGSMNEFSQSDARYAERFANGRFDAADLMDICADGGSGRSYKLRVKSLGDGDLLTESAYSPYLIFRQLPSSALAYLEYKYFDSDYYITSEEEYVDLLEYEIIFRSKSPSVRTKVSFDCYLAFTPKNGAEALWDNAFEIAATSGRYTSIDVYTEGNVMKTSFYINTINTPTRQTYGVYPQSSYSKQLHAVMPHINYDEELYRADDHEFPIDSVVNTATVKYSDELYLAAENNTRPVPVRGSSADTLYAMARNVLRRICTDDMTDAQKAHAIYDWIMWQVTYDTPATEISDGEAYSAYYLEGVFGDGATPIGGVVYYPYAVCDGMSKAYSLMCNIEGIPCVRVSGTAGNSVANAGGHAWNKVYIDGGWYVVDCTWGDSQGELTLNGRTSVYELGTHEYLFLTDAQADITHFEPYEAGVSNIDYAPQTADKEYCVYEDMVYNGTEINCYIARSEDVAERVDEIATEFARSYRKRNSVYIPGGPNNGVYSVDYEGIEIKVDDSVSVSLRTVTAAATLAVRSVLRTADVQVAVYDNIITILVKD